ncbi:ABC transporter permease [Nocardiopsis sp. JB363]|uniref:ABC transporter permease n=1 Tax=Nocardiopsis sp. JB363 TaxID=1434837 RepID=UPI00097A5699|nr:ABC transporter permease [Nocardiopsis sp. JB363]SIO86803.1 Putrescine transport system permease protein PotI (TC 3.A.1.11.2) [Nocardiopsis sp. JB363]
MSARLDVGPPTAPANGPAPTTPGTARTRPRRHVDWGRLYTWLVLAWLFTPILFMAAFSFNDPAGKHNITWQGFTLRWYGDILAYPDLTQAMLNSVSIALLTMVGAGTLGTLLGLALGRFSFRGKQLTNLVMFSAISAPEVVLGAALLSTFLMANVTTGYWTTVIAHVMFCVSFVAITVRARVITLDPALEEAARDLGAGPFTTFRLITLPMLFPAIMAGGLLAFALSIDDYIITTFVSGDVTTFPLWVWGSTRVGIPPQVNVMGTLLFAVGVAMAVVNIVMVRRRS